MAFVITTALLLNGAGALRTIQFGVALAENENWAGDDGNDYYGADDGEGGYYGEYIDEDGNYNGPDDDDYDGNYDDHDDDDYDDYDDGDYDDHDDDDYDDYDNDDGYYDDDPFDLSDGEGGYYGEYIDVDGNYYGPYMPDPEDEYDADLKLIYPKNNGTVPANQPITIKWADKPSVNSWHVEVYRDNVPFTYDRVWDNPRLSTIEAEWATPGAKFIVNIQSVSADGYIVYRLKQFSFTVAKKSSSGNGGKRSGNSSAVSSETSKHSSASKSSLDALLGDWQMIEYRKDVNDDVIPFDITIISIDKNGKVTLDWGSSGRISGEWDEGKKVLTVFNRQAYVLHNGTLGGGNEDYSGIAFKKGKKRGNTRSPLGSWTMTEYRKDVNDDVILFDIEILSIDSNGNVDLYWGDSGRISGKWDNEKKALIVHNKQTYIFRSGVMGGGNKKYSGIAFPKK